MSSSKPNVTIRIDRDHLQDAAPRVVMVAGIDDYAPVCRDMCQALHRDSEIEICVRDPHISVWLPRFASNYGEEHINIIHYTPRHVLAERWNVTLPGGVTDNDILEAGVLKEQIFPAPGQSFEDIIFAHYLSAEFNFPSLQIKRLGLLLGDYDKTKWDASLSLSLVSRVFQEKLLQWENNATNEDTRFLINCLKNDPAALKQDLINFKILRNYPQEQGEKVLSKKWKLFQKRHVDTDALPIRNEDTKEVATNIDYYLAIERSQVTDGQKLLQLMDQMSGYLPREFYVVEELLHEHPDWISEHVLSKIRTCFAPIAEDYRPEIQKLRSLIKPAFPPDPDSEWEAARWLDWVRLEYMPYYAWLETYGGADELLSAYSERFSDWFYDHFSALKNSEPDLFEFASLSQETERIRQRDAISLVLLIDNLNLVHFEELCRRFNANGLTLETVKPKFSLIPTATEVNKAALITMQGNPADFATDSYPDIVRQAWESLLAPNTARYLSKIGELQKMQEIRDTLLFLNYLPIDDALHADSSKTGQSHTDVINGSLETLAKSVAAFAQKFQIKERLQVYVLSDHGSTRIAKTVINILDKDFYKNVAKDKHHRYLALDDEKFDSLPQMAHAQCYLLDRRKTGTHKNFIVARGYDRFVDTSESFFVHGGLSPEEVVVPFARFSFSAIEPQPLTIRLLKSEYRYSIKSHIAFEVGNPNDYDLTNVTLSLVDVESEDITLPVLKSKQLVQDMEFVTAFYKANNISRENTRHLTLRCRFECQGRVFHPADVTFDITLKTIMEDYDDGFDL